MTKFKFPPFTPSEQQIILESLTDKIILLRKSLYTIQNSKDFDIDSLYYTSIVLIHRIKETFSTYKKILNQ